MSEGTFSTMGIVIFIAILVIIFIFRKALGRGFFGVIVFVSMLFLSIYLIDNFTSVDLREKFNLKHYDETLTDPSKKAEDIYNSATKKGKDVAEKVDEQGTKLDEKFGIASKKGSKEWDSKVSEEDVEAKEREDAKKSSENKKEMKKDVKKGNDKNTITVTYTEANNAIKKLALTENDRNLILSMSPLVKTTLTGEKISVTNEDMDKNMIKIKYKE